MKVGRVCFSLKFILVVGLLIFISALGWASPAKWVGYWGGNTKYPGTRGYKRGRWEDPPVCYHFKDTQTHQWTEIEKEVASRAIEEWNRVSKTSLTGKILEGTAPKCHQSWFCIDGFCQGSGPIQVDIYLRWEDQNSFFHSWGDPNGDGNPLSISGMIGFYVPIRIAPSLGIDPCSDLKSTGFLTECSVISLNKRNPQGWFTDSTPTRTEEFEWKTVKLCGYSKRVLKARRGGPAYGKQDLYTVIKHEFGHALGLVHSGGCDGIPWTAGKEDNDGSLMWEGVLGGRRPLGQVVTVSARQHLTRKDKEALRDLYPPKPQPPPPPPDEEPEPPPY